MQIFNRIKAASTSQQNISPIFRLLLLRQCAYLRNILHVLPQQKRFIEKLCADAKLPTTTKNEYLVRK